jgi:hypothetical protein
MLTAHDNSEISDEDPRNYFPSIPPRIANDVFTAALVPAAFRDGSKTYAEFVNSRAQALAAAARNLISKGSASNGVLD